MLKCKNVGGLIIAAVLLVFASVTFCLAQDIQTRYGKISIVALDKQGNKIDGNGIMDDYKKIQYYQNDKLIHEELDEAYGQPIPELVKVFKQSKSDSVLVLSDSGGQMGLCAIQFITVSPTGVKFSNIYTDGQGEPSYSQKGDIITVKFKQLKPVKTVTYSNGKIK